MTKGLVVEQINKDTHSVFDVLCSLLLPSIASIAFVGTVLSAFSVEIPKAALLIASAAASVIFYFIGALKKRKRTIAAIFLSLAVLLALIFTFNSFISSIKAAANEVFAAIGTRFCVIMPTLETDNSGLLFVIAFAACCTLCASYAHSRKSLSVPLVFAALIFIFSVTMQRASGFFLLLFSFYLFAAIMQKITKRVSPLLFIILPAFLLLFINPPAELFQAIKETGEAAVYGKAEGLPEGNFANLRAFNPSEKAALQITCEKPTPMYLRGFVGSVYNKNGFESLDNKTLYNSADLFYRLHQNNYFAQRYALLQNGKNVTVTNLGVSKKYIYLPYETVDFDFSQAAIGDETAVSNRFFGTSSYSFTAAENSLQTLSQLAKNNDNNELHYRSFAYENYLSVPEDTLVFLKNLLSLDGEEISLFTAKQKIRDFLLTNISYNEYASFNEKTDFVQNFLGTTHSGYFVHYAAAATLMLRACGIPARYVEGFVVTKSDAFAAEAGKGFVITQKNAHAWAEYYLDGVGFVPFETTPQMMNQMPLEGGDKAPLQQEADEKEMQNEQESKSELIAEKSKKPVPLNILLIISAVLSASVAALFIRALIKHLRLNVFLKKGALKVFENTVFLLQKANVIKNEREIYTQKHAIYDFTENKEIFENALFAYEKKRYGKQELNKSEHESIEKLHSEIINKIKQRQTVTECLKNRFISCIF